MSELKIGDFIPVEDTTAGKRRGKYAVVVDAHANFLRRCIFSNDLPSAKQYFSVA